MDYHILIESCSARVRNLPDPTKLYDDPLEKYMKTPFYRSPASDEQVRMKYVRPNRVPPKSTFSNQGYILGSENFQSCFMIMFAASAALQLM